jgi:hypothetical protein
MHKVQIEKSNHIPNTIELARKTSKINDRLEVHKQHLVEVLGCPCEHPSVIKFLNIHSKITMAIYAF